MVTSSDKRDFCSRVSISAFNKLYSIFCCRLIEMCWINDWNVHVLAGLTKKNTKRTFSPPINRTLLAASAYVSTRKHRCVKCVRYIWPLDGGVRQKAAIWLCAQRNPTINNHTMAQFLLTKPQRQQMILIWELPV